MNNYEDSKKVRRIASVIYLLIMAVILGGTYLSNTQKESAKKALQESSIPLETTVVYSDNQARD
jgi:hypothetical protein